MNCGRGCGAPDELCFVELQEAGGEVGGAAAAHLVVVVYLDGDEGRGALDVLPAAVHHHLAEHQQLVPGRGQRLLDHLDTAGGNIAGRLLGDIGVSWGSAGVLGQPGHLRGAGGVAHVQLGEWIREAGVIQS